MIKNLFQVVLLVLIITPCFSQENSPAERSSDSLRTDMKKRGVVVDGKIDKRRVNPLAPSKAAFYSAVFPGLGQIYNRRYWKLPIVYGAIGTGVYAYIYNDDLYNRFRDAFKRRRAGFTDDEFYDVNNSGLVPGSPDLSDEALQDAQERYQRDRDLALLITIALYALNIIDANVDAHLRQFNVDDKLTFDLQPYLEYHPITSDPNYGVSLTLKF